MSELIIIFVSELIMRETHIGRGQRSSSLVQRAERLRSCAVTTREVSEILSESVLSDSVLESVVLHAEKKESRNKKNKKNKKGELIRAQNNKQK